MELIWLEDFVALASLGNFSRAAEARHVTQPAFSRRIRALESSLGVTLFDRAAGGDLTAAGEALRPGAEEILRRVAQISQQAREAERKSVSTLVFAATHALSFTFFPGWMRDLESGGPLGPLRLISDSMEACESLMLQGGAQFLLCHHQAEAPARFDPAQFTDLIVGKDRLEPFSAPTATGAPRWSLDDPDATGTPYLAYSAESGLGRILQATILGDARGAGFDAVFTSHLAATLMSMARDGRGVCWLPRALAGDDIAAGRLVPATRSSDWSTSLDVCLFRPQARQTDAAEAFWTLAQARAGQGALIR